LAAQQAVDRDRAAAQRAALDAKEAQLRLQKIINYWQLPAEPDGRRRWYFTTRRHTINYLYVSNPTADRLSAGDVAIVEEPGAEEEHYVLVEREAAEHIAPIDRRMIRFANSLSTDT
jgi:uncharacterized protein YaiL (DUF2058 family)